MQMAIFQSLVNRSGNLGGFLQGDKKHILNTKAELLPNVKSLLQSLGALEHQRRFSHKQNSILFTSLILGTELLWLKLEKNQPKADIWHGKIYLNFGKSCK